MYFNDLIKDYNAINNAVNFTENKILAMEEDLKKSLSSIDSLEFTIIATGSYGRSEASEESDLDLFIFCKDQETKNEIQSKKEEIGEVIKRHIAKDAGDTGTFGFAAIDIFSEILKNIGGSNDTNISLTRRMLFLLEGRSIHKKEIFNKYKNSLLAKYLESTSGSPIDRFLLNDIIRYYRTITTDFQYKVDEDGKSWGIRNIKLRFSRKLLYFAGIISISAINNRSEMQGTISQLSSLFELPPLERIFQITQFKPNEDINNLIKQIFNDYNHFLSIISDRESRKELEEIQTKSQRLDSTLYSSLSVESISFTENLHKLLELSFEKSHPIHIALIF